MLPAGGDQQCLTAPDSGRQPAGAGMRSVQQPRTRGSVQGLSPTLQPDSEGELLLPQFPQPSDRTNSKSNTLCLSYISLKVLNGKRRAELAVSKGWRCVDGS